MRQLTLVHNNGYDTILRVDNGRIVSEWTVTREIARELAETTYAGDWDVQDSEGLTRDDGSEREIADFGDAVLTLTEDKGVTIHDDRLATERAEFYGLAWPARA
jgi:hypothetical protein